MGPRLLVSPDFLQSINTNILPRDTATYDVGSDTLRWNNGYFAGVIDAGGFEVSGEALSLKHLADVDDALSPADGQVLTYDATLGVWTAKDVSGIGGATTFLELTDTPSSYTSSGGYLVRVKSTEDGLEFVAGGSGSGIDADMVDGYHASDFALSSHTHDASDITSGTLTRPFKITSGDSYINNYGLCIGGTSRRTSGEGLELYGGTSSALISVQDGNGRIQMKWNATRGTNETFLVGGENAGRWEFNPNSEETELFAIYFGDGSGTSAGDTINWQTALLFGTDGLKVFFGGMFPGSDDDLDLGSSSLRWKTIYVNSIRLYGEEQDTDSRYWGGYFIKGWSYWRHGSESDISYITDETSPVGTEVIELSSYVWVHGPRIRLERDKNYIVEFWVKKVAEGTDTSGKLYMVVAEYDANGNPINGDGTDYHYPLKGYAQTNLPLGEWVHFRFLVGPDGTKDHHSDARYISLGFIANYATGNDTLRFTGFRIRPVGRYFNIIPEKDASYDLGSSSLRWKNAYFSGTVYIGGDPAVKGANGTKNIFVASTAPTAEATNDIWIQI